MLRQIIEIDEAKCTGCGLCAEACHEGAIGIVDGKAKLLRDDYCDGLGDCLPSCPADAIHFVEREAAPYDAASVAAHRGVEAANEGVAESVEVANEGAAKSMDASPSRTDEAVLPCGCPGTQTRLIRHENRGAEGEACGCAPHEVRSRLSQWPVQIKLVPVKAPYFKDAKLLVAADCTAYAYGNFHERFIKGRITLVGCPKLDDVDYSEKLTAILRENDIKSVTVTRMEVPCCGGLENAVKKALMNCGKLIPWQVVTITADGRELD